MKFRIITSQAILLALISQTTYANPHWNPQVVPKDTVYATLAVKTPEIRNYRVIKDAKGIDVVRLQLDWRESDDTFALAKAVIEPSGTSTLLKRSLNDPKLGSYVGVLKDQNGKAVYYDAVGTGKEYRKLARAVNFRFPLPQEKMTFEFYAENPTSGAMEKVLTETIDPSKLEHAKVNSNVEVRELVAAKVSPSLRVNFYAEGYRQDEKELFWQHATKAATALQQQKFPGVEHMSLYAVFAPSNQPLGKARELGLPVPEYDSNLGLFYPYWDNFGRWYNILYPTREDKFRTGLAAAPYDYPVILVNSAEYWGVGNYMALTAVPAANSLYFTYILIHEFGHFFGLNEEYEGGGRTELEFAPGISEPWSQNITFLADMQHAKLKWNKFVDKSTMLPTPANVWQDNPPIYGAYRGGYAGSQSVSPSHKPGRNCVMENRPHFCEICTKAINEVINRDLGNNNIKA